ncbi:MAG: hypothetical protein ACRDRT_11525 [Pseudonocardiaceae bacterium]
MNLEYLALVPEHRDPSRFESEVDIRGHGQADPADRHYPAEGHRYKQQTRRDQQTDGPQMAGPGPLSQAAPPVLGASGVPGSMVASLLLRNDAGLGNQDGSSGWIAQRGRLGTRGLPWTVAPVSRTAPATELPGLSLAPVARTPGFRWPRPPGRILSCLLLTLPRLPSPSCRACPSCEQPIAVLAKQLSISESCLRNWLAQADTDENGSDARLTQCRETRAGPVAPGQAAPDGADNLARLDENDFQCPRTELTQNPTLLHRTELQLP